MYPECKLQDAEKLTPDVKKKPLKGDSNKNALNPLMKDE